MQQASHRPDDLPVAQPTASEGDEMRQKICGTPHQVFSRQFLLIANNTFRKVYHDNTKIYNINGTTNIFHFNAQ